jgi:hypothetical protein
MRLTREPDLMRIKQLAANSAERCFAVVLDDGKEAVELP